jgi:hypothetical protein
MDIMVMLRDVASRLMPTIIVLFRKILPKIGRGRAGGGARGKLLECIVDIGLMFSLSRVRVVATHIFSRHKN